MPVRRHLHRRGVLYEPGNVPVQAQPPDRLLGRNAMLRYVHVKFQTELTLQRNFFKDNAGLTGGTSGFEMLRNTGKKFRTVQPCWFCFLIVIDCFIDFRRSPLRNVAVVVHRRPYCCFYDLSHRRARSIMKIKCSLYMYDVLFIDVIRT